MQLESGLMFIEHSGPATMLSTSQIIHLILAATLRGRRSHCHPHFREKIETMKPTSLNFQAGAFT